MGNMFLLIGQAPETANKILRLEYMASEETYSFKHYLLGNSVPVRVLFADSDGLKAGAMVPDASQGKLVFANSYLSRLEQSHEVVEIMEDEFDRLCEEMYTKKNINNYPAGPVF